MQNRHAPTETVCRFCPCPANSLLIAPTKNDENQQEKPHTTSSVTTEKSRFIKGFPATDEQRLAFASSAKGRAFESRRVLFAGEIAGFLNPMGEGISAAMESGFWAARAIADHFADPAGVCADYQRNTQALKSYMERQWSFVGRMAGTFSEMIL